MKIDGHGQTKVLTPSEIGELFAEFSSDRPFPVFATSLSGKRMSF